MTMKTVSKIALTVALAPGMTLAVQAPANAAYSTQCATGTVESLANNLPIRASYSTSASVLEWGQMGDRFSCYRNQWALGSRYTACGVSQANGWLHVITNNGMSDGWAYMTCLEDV
ncbi:hypothetical protein RM555_14255 [Micromonospora sp. DSM 115977]|uniref:SH3 domain-containing protein n=1 Tax=Micromonospora reichwaldensis TaxID=3075516 RepID=A0ABU2WX79_9ACTN|nr:hypothetical protein [Micromonospora sp. DSM 115977]MDT0530150.1 hypothetical protein [Micromonospora sp. DSM 115977]